MISARRRRGRRGRAAQPPRLRPPAAGPGGTDQETGAGDRSRSVEPGPQLRLSYAPRLRSEGPYADICLRRTDPGRTDGERRAHRRYHGCRGGGAAAPADPDHQDRPSRKRRKAEAKPKAPRGGRQGPGQEPGDLHPPVLGHDRRRPAAGAVSGHPGQAGAHKDFSSVILKTREDVEAGAALADAMRKHPEDLRHALLEHDRGGRSGRYSRHHPQAARDLHREVGQAEGGSQVRHDLPDRGRRDRRGRGRAPSCGRSSRRSPQLFAGLGAQLPLPTRIVIAAEQQPGVATGGC